jgi:hypothetical protein
MEQVVDPTYRASVAHNITGVPPHSQRTWRKLGLLTVDKAERSWTEHTLGDLVTMATIRELGHRFGLELKHAAEIGREAAKVGLGRRRVVGKRYGDFPFLVVTNPGGEIHVRSAAGIEWDLVMASPFAIVVDAVALTMGIVNALRAEREKVPAWWAALEHEYSSRKGSKP